MALGRGEDGGGVKPEDLGVNSFIHNFPTPNGGTIPGLVDGWGKPLAFCRWPVFSPPLNPGGLPQAGDNNDPVDPSGLLVSTTWQGTGGYAPVPAVLPPGAGACGQHGSDDLPHLPADRVGRGRTAWLGLDKEPLITPLRTRRTLTAPPLRTGSARCRPAPHAPTSPTDDTCTRPWPRPSEETPLMCDARRSPRRRKAFTLIELLVVMALILVIVSLGIGYVVFGQDNQHSMTAAKPSPAPCSTPEGRRHDGMPTGIRILFGTRGPPAHVSRRSSSSSSSPTTTTPGRY